MVIFLSACVEGILQLFTNIYLHRKLLIFIKNNHDCKAVDLYNTRMRYAVLIESSDFLRNIPWLASRSGGPFFERNKYLLIPTSTESIHFLKETIVSVSLWICKVQKIYTE